MNICVFFDVIKPSLICLRKKLRRWKKGIKINYFLRQCVLFYIILRLYDLVLGFMFKLSFAENKSYKYIKYFNHSKIIKTILLIQTWYKFQSKLFTMNISLNVYLKGSRALYKNCLA